MGYKVILSPLALIAMSLPAVLRSDFKVSMFWAPCSMAFWRVATATATLDSGAEDGAAGPCKTHRSNRSLTCPYLESLVSAGGFFCTLSKWRHAYYFLIDFIGFLTCKMDNIERLVTECKV